MIESLRLDWQSQMDAHTCKAQAYSYFLVMTELETQIQWTLFQLGSKVSTN